jgi:hypothetical protein
MRPNAVQEILGPPERVAGGTFTFWSYSGGGRVSFFQGRLDTWSEPESP